MKISKRKTRKHILEFISNTIGWRVGNIKRGTATQMDKQLADEALGFRSLCLFSCLDDKELKKLWNDSNLEFML